jgi:hypothetical protein
VAGSHGKGDSMCIQRLCMTSYFEETGGPCQQTIVPARDAKSPMSPLLAIERSPSCMMFGSVTTRKDFVASLIRRRQKTPLCNVKAHVVREGSQRAGTLYQDGPIPGLSGRPGKVARISTRYWPRQSCNQASFGRKVSSSNGRGIVER